MGQFQASFFRQNRERLMMSIQEDAVVVAANGVLQRSADTEFRFRQDSSFWYFTGINQADLILVIETGSSMVVLPKREAHRDLWEGEINPSEILAISGVDKVISYQEFLAWLKKRAQTGKRVARPLPSKSYVKAFGLYVNPARAHLESLLKRYRVQVADCRLAIARLRQIKQPIELEAIKEAINVTCATLADIKQQLRNYPNESDVERALSIGFLQRGLTNHSFMPIVASGKNAYSIHYRDNNKPILAHELLLLDVGAESQHYAADITRTWAVGKPEKSRVNAHAFVASAVDFAISKLRVGLTIREFDKIVRDFVAKQATDQGYIGRMQDVNEVFPYSVSHFLGLDVHDAGDYETPLIEGSVITVEPGLHLKNERIGVRIENDVLLTRKGPIVLSNKLSNAL